MNTAYLDPKGYGFEWWYLQVTSSEYAVTLTIRTTELLGGSISQPYVSATIAWFGGPFFSDQIPFAREDLANTGEFLTIGSWLREHATGWHVSLRGDDWSL